MKQEEKIVVREDIIIRPETQKDYKDIISLALQC